MHGAWHTGNRATNEPSRKGEGPCRFCPCPWRKGPPPRPLIAAAAAPADSGRCNRNRGLYWSVCQWAAGLAVLTPQGERVRGRIPRGGWVAALPVRQFCLNGGGQARVCRTDPAGDIPAARLRQQGCDVPLAPDLPALSSADGMAAIAALREAAAQARALLVLDPPVDAQSVVGIQAWRANLAAALGELPDAAVYFP